jgi:hypothetical protein
VSSLSAIAAGPVSVFLMCRASLPLKGKMGMGGARGKGLGKEHTLAAANGKGCQELGITYVTYAEEQSHRGLHVHTG